MKCVWLVHSSVALEKTGQGVSESPLSLTAGNESSLPTATADSLNTGEEEERTPPLIELPGVAHTQRTTQHKTAQQPRCCRTCRRPVAPPAAPDVRNGWT